MGTEREKVVELEVSLKETLATASAPTNHAISLLLLISLDSLREGRVLTQSYRNLDKTKGIEGPGNNKNNILYLRSTSHFSRRLLLKESHLNFVSTKLDILVSNNYAHLTFQLGKYT